MHISNEFFNLYSKWWTRMDANFMNAKEMKYNVEKKENNIHLEERWRRRKNYIHFSSLHPQSSSFHHPNTSTPSLILLHLHNHSLAIFACFCLYRCFCFFCVWKDFGHVKKRGQSGGSSSNSSRKFTSKPSE